MVDIKYGTPAAVLIFADRKPGWKSAGNGAPGISTRMQPGPSTRKPAVRSSGFPTPLQGACRILSEVACARSQSKPRGIVLKGASRRLHKRRQWGFAGGHGHAPAHRAHKPAFVLKSIKKAAVPNSTLSRPVAPTPPLGGGAGLELPPSSNSTFIPLLCQLLVSLPHLLLVLAHRTCLEEQEDSPGRMGWA